MVASKTPTPSDRFRGHLNGFSPPKNGVESIKITVDVEKEEKLGLWLIRDLVVKVLPNSISGGKVKCGDLILSVNGKSEKIKETFTELSKNGAKEAKIEVARLRTRFNLPPAAVGKLGQPREGFDYACCVLYFLRGMPMGLNVIDHEGRVYVESVDRDSSASITMGQGDCILSIEDNKIDKAQQVSDLMAEYSKKSGFVRLLCEWPNCDPMKNWVRGKLMAAATAPPNDLPLPADVMEILRLKRERDATTTKSSPRLIPILKLAKPNKESVSEGLQTAAASVMKTQQITKLANAKKGVHFNEETRVQTTPIDADTKLLVKPLPMKSVSEKSEARPTQASTEDLK